MDILKLFFFLFSFFSLVHSKKHCPVSYCNDNRTLPIRYPFKLLQDKHPNHQNCSYINLRCNNQGTPILNLPHSAGDFFVRYIDYYYSIIQLYDPDNCLPKRIMSLNLSFLDPFMAIYDYMNYTFYSCPSEIIRLSNLTYIDCLSNVSTSTVATRSISGRVMETLQYRCSEIITLLVPVSGMDLYDDFIGNQNDLFLQWIGPSCENCPRVTELVPDNVVFTAYIMLYFGTIIMPLLICLGCCVHFVRLFWKEAE